MKKAMKTIAFLVAMALPVVAKAQSKVEIDLGIDIVSNYIWRGQDLGSAAIQPRLGLSYKGLSFSAWGSYGFVDKDDTKELDLTLSYSISGFTVGVTDCYCVKGSTNCPAKYFLYDANRTAHVFEANVGYDFGILSVNWFTNFAGADGRTESGKRAYASYFEIAAPFRLGGIEWLATVGAVPYNDGGFYSDNNASGFAVTNVALKAAKEIKITETFRLPLFASLTANPSSQKLFFTAGISF